MVKNCMQELQDIHFTSVEKFLNAWVARKINQRFLKAYNKGDVAKVIIKVLKMEETHLWQMVARLGSKQEME